MQHKQSSDSHKNTEMIQDILSKVNDNKDSHEDEEWGVIEDDLPW